MILIGQIKLDFIIFHDGLINRMLHRLNSLHIILYIISHPHKFLNLRLQRFPNQPQLRLQTSPLR